MANDDLVEIHVASGVNEAGAGFCTITARGGGGRILIGQLDPETVRTMALDWLGAAEAAEQDAAVLRVVRKLGLPDDLAGAVIAELRDTRAE